MIGQHDECEAPQNNPPSEEIANLLRGAKRIAVVGLSDNPSRDSHVVAQYLDRHGYEIIPVNPSIKTVLGKTSYASLKDIPGHIDIVDVFRKSDAVPGIVDEAIAVKAAAIWLQLGVVHNASAQKATDAGLAVVQSKCIKVEHARLVGS